MGDRLNILLIGGDEDEQVIIGGLVSEILPRGHRFEKVSAYSSALEAIRRRGHDVYLLDCDIGGRKGLDLLEDAGADLRRAPVIFLCEDADPELRVFASKAGAADCLVKSDLSAPLLERAILYAVELSRAHEELRAVEERFGQLAGNINMVFWITSLGGDEIIYVNQAFESIWGIPVETVRKRPRSWLDALHPEDRDRAPAIFGRRKPEEFGTFEYRIERPDNSIRWIRDRFFPIRGAAGEIHRVARISEDVTEEKRMRKEAEYHLQQIVQADKMASLGEVVAGVAHEINNPNSFIAYNVPLLEETWKAFEPIISDYASTHPEWRKGALSLDEFRIEMREIIEAIGIGSNRISSVVSNLKDFARTDEGIAARPVRINEVIEKTLTIVGAQLRQQASRVDVSLADNLPSIYGHLQKLEQVMANLLLNAAHALPAKDEGRISVATRYIERLGSVLIEIEDNGKGIKTEHMSRIFEPFFTTRRAKGGTGLGLSVSYGLVREHGGIIGALSRPGIGSRFTVYLPVEREAGISLSPIILCVDDDQGFLNMLRTIFIKVNTDVETLGSSEAALGYLEEHPEVDIVLSDLFMPGMDGWELLVKVKARFPLIAFILYTGRQDALKEKPKGVPFPDFFLEKPFTVQQLTRLVDSFGRQVL